MLLATASSLLPRMAELLASFGLTLFLQTGLLVGAGLLGSRWLRKRGAAPRSTLLRLTLIAVAACPFIAMSLHLSGFRFQPFNLPTSVPPAAPAAQDEPALVPNDANARVVTAEAIRREPARPTPARLIAPLGDVPESAVPILSRMADPREEKPTSAATGEGQSADQSDPPRVETRQVAQFSTRRSWLPGAWNVWCIAFAVGWPLVSGTLLARLTHTWLQMRRVRRQARPAPDPVQAACARLAQDLSVESPPVLISSQAPAPCLLGIRHPVILYPAGERATTVEVLCHELAHLARKDCLWFLIGHIVQAILFFQPLLRLLVRAFERASDDVCDDLVLECRGSRRRYACELVRIARIQQESHGRLLAALGAVSFRSLLGKRVERIVDLSRTLSPRTGRRDRLALTAATLSCTLVICLVQVRATPPEATQDNMPAVAQPSAAGGSGPPEESGPASLASGTSIAAASMASTSQVDRRQADGDPAVAEAMRTRVNSWLASAASTVRQTARARSDNSSETETPEQPSSEPASAPPSPQPVDSASAATAADEGVDTQPDDERAGALNSLKRMELQGTVYDDGKPAANADVWAYPFEFEDNPWQMVESRTDAEGRFKLSLPPGEWRVMARKGNRSGAANNQYGLVGIVLSNPPEPCIIRLAPSGILRGRLLDNQTGQPIPRGCIWIDDCGLVRADEHGHYEARGLSLDPHHFVVLCPGYRRSYRLLDTSLRPEAELDIRCERGGKVFGKVVDERGRPMPGALCGHVTSGHGSAIVAMFERCDEKGECVWDGAPYGQSLSLDAIAPGYKWEGKEVTVTEDSGAAHIVFKLKRESRRNMSGPTRTVSGVVRTSDGKAVSGAKVRLYFDFKQSRRLETTTDAGGRFALRRVPDGIGYMMATARGHSPAFASIIRQGNLDGDLVLDSGRTVRGTVQDSNGRPLEGVMVLPVAAASIERHCTEPWVWQLHTLTDRNGRFELTNLPKDGFRYDFCLYSEGEIPSRTDLQDNTVVTLPGSGAFRGRVIDPEGKPVRDFRILLALAELEPAKPASQPSFGPSNTNTQTSAVYVGLTCVGVMYTSPDGTFVLGGLALNNVNRVMAEVPGYGRAVVDRVYARALEKLGPPEELTLQLCRPHQLRVHVVQDRDPKTPVVGASVSLAPYDFQGNAGYRCPAPYFQWGYNDRWSALKRTDPTGWAPFPDLSLDESTIIVQAEGFARERLEWRADQPDKPDVSVRLKPECVIEGVISDRSGNRPLREFRVALERGNWKQLSGTGEWGPICAPGKGGWCHEDIFRIQVGPEDKGRFRISGLPAGRYVLQILTPHFEVQPAGQFYREEFTLSEGGSHKVVAAAAADPVLVDLSGRPIKTPSGNGRWPSRGGGAVGLMGGAPNGVRASGR
jgi:beta-lactamase regulating signal transducer with metallopeptidase domain